MTGDISEPIIIAEIQKNARERILIRLDHYKGSAIVHCWTWYASREGQLRPGRTGLAVALHHLPALAEAMQRALTTAIETGRLPPP